MQEKIQLVKPVTFNNELITEINLNLDALTGADLIEVERQFITANAINEAVQIKEYSKEYQVMVAARASGLPVSFYEQLGGRDFSQVTTKVQYFFTRMESVE